MQCNEGLIAHILMGVNVWTQSSHIKVFLIFHWNSPVIHNSCAYSLLTLPKLHNYITMQGALIEIVAMQYLMHACGCHGTGCLGGGRMAFLQ